MKFINHFQDNKTRGCCLLVLALCGAHSPVSGADTNAPATNAPAANAPETNAPPAKAPSPLTPEQMFEGGTNAYKNWIEFSSGGFFNRGNSASFQQQHQMSAGPFGGIEGLHYGTNLDKTTTMTVDGRAIVSENDYKLRLDIEREKVGYLRLSYKEFRTWTDGDGGFFPPTGRNFPLSGDALGLDRGNFTLEAGLTPEKGINAAFTYSHSFRDGMEASTIWGGTHPDGGALTRGLSPSFANIQESQDSFGLDLTDHVKATDLGLGLRFEFGRLEDALNITEYPGEPIQQRITSQQGTSYDLFDVHSYSETWVKTNLQLSSGFSYSHLDSTFSGNRIYGSDFDVSYTPNPQYGFGYYNLTGSSRMNEYVLDANLYYRPLPDFTIIPSVRLQEDYSDSASTGMETLGASLPVAFGATGNTGDLDARTRLDLAYRGFTNWVLHARVDLTEVDGNLDEYGGLIPVGGIGVPAIQSGVFERNFIQKYAAGIRWYPSRRLTLDVGGYYKYDAYHYDTSLDTAPGGYPGFLEMQKFQTYDGNTRLTWRPLQNVSLVSRYEYQWSTIHTAPNAASGLPEVESSTMQSHILAQDITWTPWSRLSLQTGFNYVLSDTFTPASDVTQAILDARNNYWSVNFTSGLVLDAKTDLTLSYFYYQADDYIDNSLAGVPYGAGGQEHSVTANLTRKISERIRVSLKYGYFRYLDAPSGGNADYGVNLVYASMRYRF